MTDLHCHVLPFVDDGSDSVENSISMIEEAVRQGVKNLVLTPHYRKGFFFIEDKKVIEVFSQKILPGYIDNERVDILLNNTDFGVGGENDE